MEVQGSNGLGLFHQVGGDGYFLGKEPEQPAYEGGGQSAVEQLPGHIGAQGQAAVPQKGHDLAVDRHSCPDRPAMDSRPVRAPSVREDTPEDISSSPVSSFWAHCWDRPKGERRVDRRADEVDIRPEKVKIRMATVKKRMKAQMLRVTEVPR